MMETLFELRAQNGFCRVFDFFADAQSEMNTLIMQGVFGDGDLYISHVVTE